MAMIHPVTIPQWGLTMTEGTLVKWNASEGDEVKIGVRPEHLLINESGDANWNSKVFVVEKLGSGTFLYLEKEGEPLVVQVEGESTIKVGDSIKIGFLLNF